MRSGDLFRVVLGHHLVLHGLHDPVEEGHAGRATGVPAGRASQCSLSGCKVARFCANLQFRNCMQAQSFPAGTPVPVKCNEVLGVAQPHVRRPGRRQRGELLHLHLDPYFDVARDLGRGGLDEMTEIEILTAIKSCGRGGHTDTRRRRGSWGRRGCSQRRWAGRLPRQCLLSVERTAGGSWPWTWPPSLPAQRSKT